MPLPTQAPTTAEGVYNQAVGMAANVLAMAKATRATIAAGPVTVQHLVALFDCLREAKDRGEKFALVPAIEDYAKTVMGADYSITAAFGLVIEKGTLVTDWIAANAPGDGKGGIVTREFVVGAQTKVAEMAVEQSAPLLPLLDALIAAIEA